MVFRFSRVLVKADISNLGPKLLHSLMKTSKSRSNNAQQPRVEISALCKLWLKIFNYTLSCWKTKDTDQGDTLIDAKCCFPIILINGFSFLTFVVWKQKLSQEFHSVKKMLEQQMLNLAAARKTFEFCVNFASLHALLDFNC